MFHFYHPIVFIRLQGKYNDQNEINTIADDLMIRKKKKKTIDKTDLALKCGNGKPDTLKVKSEFNNIFSSLFPDFTLLITTEYSHMEKESNLQHLQTWNQIMKRRDEIYWIYFWKNILVSGEFLLVKEQLAAGEKSICDWPNDWCKSWNSDVRSR